MKKAVQRNKSIIFVLFTVAMMVAAEARSVKRGRWDAIAPSPSQTRGNTGIMPQDRIEYCGNVVYLEDDNVYVDTVGYTLVNYWERVYFACDERMNTVAILTPTVKKHKVCAVFKLKEGSVRKGDYVMVKFIAPRPAAKPDAGMDNKSDNEKNKSDNDGQKKPDTAKANTAKNPE